MLSGVERMCGSLATAGMLQASASGSLQHFSFGRVQGFRQRVNLLFGVEAQMLEAPGSRH
jgi:hypothetical protein